MHLHYERVVLEKIVTDVLLMLGGYYLIYSLVLTTFDSELWTDGGQQMDQLRVSFKMISVWRNSMSCCDKWYKCTLSK